MTRRMAAFCMIVLFIIVGGAVVYNGQLITWREDVEARLDRLEGNFQYYPNAGD